MQHSEIIPIVILIDNSTIQYYYDCINTCYENTYDCILIRIHNCIHTKSLMYIKENVIT